ncbi:MAG: hypothetical protein JNL42_16375 [Anaerolineae bacterium]|nr:hypothetical protein [Anaerolineae bacterium]
MKRILLAFLIVVLCAGVLPAAAQDVIYQLGEGYAIVLPEDWTIQPDTLGTLNVIIGSPSADFVGLVSPPGELREVVVGNVTFDAAEVVERLQEVFFESETTPVVLEVDGRAIAYARSSSGYLIAVQMSDGWYGMIRGITDLTGSTAEALIIQLAQGFDGEQFRGAPQDLTGASADGGASSGGGKDTGAVVTGGAAGGSAGSAAGAGEPCTVSAAARDTARLRVGPGENRGAIAFLPPNTPVTATGSFTEDDGDLWYQLDKEEAMPGTSANELWVAAEEVETAGDCAVVGAADAPPVIPGVVAPPPAAGGAGDSGAAVVGGAAPLSGRWQFSIHPTTNASCQGGQNIAIPSAEMFDDLSYPVFISVSADGSSFTNEGDRYTRTGPNAYFGTYTFDSTFNSQLYINVVSSRSMNGSAVGNFSIDGTPCSFTVGFTMTYG